MSDLVKSGDGNIITLLHRGQQPVNPFPGPYFFFFLVTHCKDDIYR